jgi:hypothetical protein
VLPKSPKVGRPFKDYESVERDYYKRSGFFPIMRAVVVKHELATEHPKLAKAITKAVTPPTTRWPSNM